jgi:hypothetical protein
VRDPVLLSILHRDWRECALCGQHRGRLSLHHISKHPRDDVEANLVMLCGSGTTGCHGEIEAGLTKKFEGRDRAAAWITRTYYVEVA